MRVAESWVMPPTPPPPALVHRIPIPDTTLKRDARATPLPASPPAALQQVVPLAQLRNVLLLQLCHVLLELGAGWEACVAGRE